MQITPEIDLPDLYEPFPEDLAVLCHSNLRGLKQLTVHRMLQRGQYKIIASVALQDKPTKTSVPKYGAEEICETAMQIIAHDVLETDDPGNYKVSFVCAGGKGRKVVSKHIRMREEQSPRAVNTMDEGDLLETQMQYIGELHQVNMGLMEVVSGMIRPLLEENKEMMKICSESVKRVGEVEQARMQHELNVRRMDDETKLAIMDKEKKAENWRALYKLVVETDAMDTIVSALGKKFLGNDDSEKEQDEPVQNQAQRENVGDQAEPKRRARPLPSKSEVKSNLPAKVEPNKIAKKAQGPQDVVKSSDSAVQQTDSDDIEKLKEEAMQEINEADNLVATATALKFTIEANGQWKDIYKTLDKDQAGYFDDALSATTDEEVIECIKKLADTKIGNLIKLKSLLDKDQKKLIKILMSAAL